MTASTTEIQASAVASSVQCALAERASSLGLWCWHADATGRVFAEPEAPAAIRGAGALGSWLRSAGLRPHIESAAKAALAGDAPPPPVELFPGCWLITLAERKGSRRTNATVAMALTPLAAEQDDFTDICRGAGVEPEAVARDLSTWLAGRMPDAAQAAMVLGWSLNDLSRAEGDAATLDQFSEKLVQSYEETNLLFRLARFMNGSNDPAQVMGMICNQLAQALPFQWVGIRFGKEHGGVPELADQFILVNEPPCTKQELDGELTKMLGGIAHDDWTRLLTPADSSLARLVKSEVVAEPIAHGGKTIGVLAAGNKTGPDPDASSVEMQFLDAAADFLGVFHENLARFTEQRDLFVGTLRALTASIDAKDPYTCGHSERVAMLASTMAEAMGLERAEIEQFRIAGMVHDVGKIGVPEAVLCKGGKLSDEEFAHIRRHPEIGHGILKGIPLMAPQLPGVLHHHERWDGRGYPHNLAGEAIPVIARVLALADTFDAMSSNRSYRHALPRERVLAELERCGGTQFDPKLAPIFVKLDFSRFDQMLVGHQAQAAIVAAA
ncbi:MAG: HD-GYP domain-containing protein [Planctomycetota bacterium]|nr:HD-GYP domain-containing protein [Planctomycetota bacterium]